MTVDRTGRAALVGDASSTVDEAGIARFVPEALAGRVTRLTALVALGTMRR